MSYQNFKGDFPIVEKFFREDTDGGRVQIAVPEHVSITYFTDPQIGTFVAERNGEHCVNCRIVDEPDGTQYLLVGLQLSKCFLGEGELMAVVSEYVNDDLYSGGVRATPIPKRCGVVLYPGVSDNSDSVVSSTVLSILGSSVTRLTYASMVSLRDNSRLTSGQFYRITDYITTTTQANTQSAGHPFDVIVLALNENTLSERAWAIQSERDADGYFSNSKLEAWQIWYCLDNDISRFAWADSVNGKGVIYRMIDEWNNDVPYDFKNIQFRHPHNTTNLNWYYTFNMSGSIDYSLTSPYGRCLNNVIRPRHNQLVQYLNKIIFLNTTAGDSCYSNMFGEGCHDISFEKGCYGNSFASDCFGNKFGSGCYSNKFERSCCHLTLGANCAYNVFGTSCYSLQLGAECVGNSFGNDCESNVLGSKCVYNSFGHKCVENTLGEGCKNNVLGTACDKNEIGSQFDDNVLGPHCRKNIIGTSCKQNQFGPYCQGFSIYNRLTQCSFGNVCKNITISKPYYTNIRFDEGCSGIVLNNIYSAGSNDQVQNYHFTSGLSDITVDVVRNLSYETTVAKDSAGNVKQFCIADIFDAIEQITIKEE